MKKKKKNKTLFAIAIGVFLIATVVLAVIALADETGALDTPVVTTIVVIQLTFGVLIMILAFLTDPGNAIKRIRFINKTNNAASNIRVRYSEHHNASNAQQQDFNFDHGTINGPDGDEFDQLEMDVPPNVRYVRVMFTHDSKNWDNHFNCPPPSGSVQEHDFRSVIYTLEDKGAGDGLRLYYRANFDDYIDEEHFPSDDSPMTGDFPAPA